MNNIPKNIEDTINKMAFPAPRYDTSYYQTQLLNKSYIHILTTSIGNIQNARFAIMDYTPKDYNGYTKQQYI